MRARLLAQLNQVLQTRDTARGLIVSMPDVLFDFNKYTLKPEARERLAKISGIVLAYPDLKLDIEGFTDSIGSDEYNQELSEKRAESVRGYLVSSGVKHEQRSCTGLGKANPVADNSTACRTQTESARGDDRLRRRHWSGAGDARCHHPAASPGWTIDAVIVRQERRPFFSFCAALRMPYILEAAHAIPSRI